MESFDLLLDRLREVASLGPIPTVASGANGVGMTLMDALGISVTSLSKASFNGISVKAYTKQPKGSTNRVNLFAQVPDWSISACKSSREICLNYGYRDQQNKNMRLFCTVNAKSPNTQNLQLLCKPREGVICEIHQCEGVAADVAAWKVEKLKQRLVESCPATVWVIAHKCEIDGEVTYHYRECIYTGAAKTSELLELIYEGTITMDHLIEVKSPPDGQCNEKGPLFKIDPSNIELLFPPPKRFDLLDI